MIWLLVLSYVAIAALLLNWNVSVKAPLLLKVAAIVLVTACYAFTYFGLREMQGWPTRGALPEHFRLHWIVVDDPDKDTEDQVVQGWIDVFFRGIGTA